MRESALRGSPHRRVCERAAERRQGLSKLLAHALDLTQNTVDLNVRRSKLEREIGCLLNAPSVSIRHAQPAPKPTALVKKPGVVTVPVPDLSDPSMLLEVHAANKELDAWTRQLLSDVARIVSLVLRDGTKLAAPAVEGHSRLAPSAYRLIGQSQEVAKLRHEITRMARTDFTVLVEGESGSGKELVARLVHEESSRRRRPFIAVNCAALVETLLEAELFGIEERTATGVRGRRGKFELADGGTLFLDEVSDLSPAAQAKLLRALQERSVERVGGHATRVVNTRIVVATNQSLESMTAEGHFRADLYYRLSGVEIHVPPLRARRSDIPTLASHFLKRHSALGILRLSRSAMDALTSYDWPGNVRELERVVERAVALAASDEITLADLPPKVTGEVASILEPSLDHTHTIRTWGSRYARLVLDRCGHNKRRACRVLGISYNTLQAYLAYDGPATSVAGPAQTGDVGGRDAPRESEAVVELGGG